MPIAFKKKQAIMSGVVSVEEAETLLEWLHKNSNSKINLAECEHVHPAILQVMMAAKSNVSVWPKNESFSAWLQSALNSN